MKHLLNGLAVAAVLAIAAPGWAQTSSPSSPPPAPSAPPSAAPAPAEAPPPAAAPAPTAAPAPAPAEAPPAARHARTTAHHHPRGARGHVVEGTAMHHHTAHHPTHHRAAMRHHHPRGARGHVVMHHGVAMRHHPMRGPASDNMANQLNREELNRIQGSSPPPGEMPQK